MDCPTLSCQKLKNILYFSLLSAVHLTLYVQEPFFLFLFQLEEILSIANLLPSQQYAANVYVVLVENILDDQSLTECIHNLKGFPH